MLYKVSSPAFDVWDFQTVIFQDSAPEFQSNLFEASYQKVILVLFRLSVIHPPNVIEKLDCKMRCYFEGAALTHYELECKSLTSKKPMAEPLTLPIPGDNVDSIGFENLTCTWENNHSLGFSLILKSILRLNFKDHCDFDQTYLSISFELK